MPREGWKGFSRSPLRRIERLEKEMHDMMREIRSGENLKKIRACLIKPHSNLSKAFSRSTFMAIIPFLLLEMVIE